MTSNQESISDATTFRGEDIPKKEEKVGFLFNGIRKLMKHAGINPGELI
jgi:hypothetical protein